ncbi:hypothetical protein VN12_13105 [Pirellula sp. SH-Sr6A]|uniref:vWA domain-containing protein n=1 Tax=Pirellula sp. SH-Sr6A TaxID=1632865 RepID=UPI00078E5603|nr:hypothetical protein [Pirellula sp. SH-Sr6A]AMV33056.1 hypothetical protein VN12_13105 [Pirellula sp. SH-Sr6A]
MSRARDDGLLAQAELALEALRFKERAALYHAAAQCLQAALRQAEQGDREPLEHWFLQHRDLIDLPLSSFEITPSPDTSQEPVPTRGPVPSHVPLPHLEPAKEPQPSAHSGPAQPSSVPSVPNTSPWTAMEEAILRRQREDQSPPSACPLSPSPRELAGSHPVVGEQPVGDEEAEQHESPSHIAESISSETIPTHRVESLSTVPDASTPDIAAIVPCPFQLDDERSRVDRSKRTRWGASHLWISAAVHAIAVGLLSLVVIQQIRQPQVLAIVSATVEAEEVLVETPMESPSELDAEPLEAPAPEAPNLDPEIPDIRDPTMSEIDLSGPLLAQERAAQDVTKALQAMPVSAPGKNLVAGAEFFGVKATGNTFVYIVDCSPSMRRDNAFDFAKQEITRSLRSMKPSQRFSILFFGKEVERLEFSPGQPEEFPVPATPENVEKTLRWLARCSIQKEGLPPNDALDMAIAMQPDGVFLLFDGDTRVDVPKHLGQANRSTDILTSGEPRVPIHVVHFFLDEFASTMQRVASENLGTYRFIPRPERGSKSKR